MSTSIFNLGGISIFGGHLLPPKDNTYDLGSVARSWRNLHVQTLIYATSVVGNWSPSADDTYDLGIVGKEWKDLRIDGVAYIDALTMHGDISLGANNIISDAFTVANDGTVTTLSTIAGDYWRIGDAATTSNSLDSEDDLLVTGELEAVGTAYLGPETLPNLVSRGHSLVASSNNAAWGSSLANGAGIIAAPFFDGIDTNATGSASGIIYAYFASLNTNGSQNEFIDWDKKFRIRFCISMRDIAGDHSDSIYRVQLKEAVSEGALGAKGLGIRIDGVAGAPQDLFAESYGISLAATDLAINLVNRQPMWIDIIHTPATSIVWEVNGVVKRTETDTDKIPSGLGGAADAFCISAINGASSGDGRFYVSDISIWQEA